MVINESLGGPLYFAYKDAGPTFTLILPAVLWNIVGFSGVLMNAFVVGTTISSKKFRGTTHFLLALICFGEILHQSGHGVFLFAALSGINFIDFYTATLLLLPLLFGLNAAMLGMVLAAMDRLFAVICPKRHKKIGKSFYYLPFLAICCCIYGIFFDIYMYKMGVENAKIPVTGQITDLMLIRDSGLIFFYSTTFMNGISIFCYLLIFIVIRTKEGVTEQTNSRLTRSLAFIISINIGGYLVSLCFYHLLRNLIQSMDFFTIWQLGNLLPGICLNIGAACNGPVLYLTSSEYRKAFSHNLRQLLRIFRLKSAGNGPDETTPVFSLRMVEGGNNANGNGKGQIRRKVHPVSTTNQIHPNISF